MEEGWLREQERKAFDGLARHVRGSEDDGFRVPLQLWDEAFAAAAASLDR